MKKTKNMPKVIFRVAPYIGDSFQSQGWKNESVFDLFFFGSGRKLIALAKSFCCFCLFFFILNMLLAVYQPLFASEKGDAPPSTESSTAPKTEATTAAPGEASPKAPASAPPTVEPSKKDATGEKAKSKGKFGARACPHCHAISYVWEDETQYKWFSCPNCGSPFKA